MKISLGGKFSSSIQTFTINKPEPTRRSCRAGASRKGGPVRRTFSEGGFTLLELLVVITIIIILIGFLFPAFRGIQDQAKRTQAKNDLNQIVTAISAFYTEYGYYPLPQNITTDTTYGDPSVGGNPNNSVLDILRYDTNHGDSAWVQQINPRQVVFIEPPVAKDQTNPKLGIRFTTGAWYDPWGYQYNMIIDANYNGVTNATVSANYADLSTTYTTATDNSGDKGPKTGAIAWTEGPDDKLGNNGDGYYKDKDSGVQSDDVVSWQ
jgi:type II secretory pathway pseudopilin PulG